MTTTAKPKYQLFPPLSAEQFAALEADILKRGVMVPVELDEKGNILDGHHRAEICEKHGKEYPTVTRLIATEAHKLTHVFALNHARRHLAPHEWGVAFLQLCKARGAKVGTKGGRPKRNHATVARLSKEIGVPLRTAQHRIQLAEMHEALPPELKRDVDAQKTTIKKAEHKARALKRKAEAQSAIASTPIVVDAERCDIRHCSLAELFASGIKPDVVITDPPYERDALPLYEELAELAKGIPLVAVMVGGMYLPEIFAMMTKHLQYRWAGHYLTPSGSCRVWEPKILCGAKHILIFGESREQWVFDVFESKEGDKNHHEWGQSESGMTQIVERLTKPGQLVCDPFLGAGTTGVVALKLNRRFVGCDVDAEAVEVARRRCSQLRQTPRLPTRKYDLIYADPPWRYEHCASASRNIENQYPTLSTEEIRALQVPAADDAVLFLWTTAPKLPEALTVVEAWGFNYRTHAIWDKEKIGMGYWFRVQHEVLIVAARGNARPPSPPDRKPSIFSVARGKHSEKPDCVYEMIESMFPNTSKLELFARRKRKGWEAWGNEVEVLERQSA